MLVELYTTGISVSTQVANFMYTYRKSDSINALNFLLQYRQENSLTPQYLIVIKEMNFPMEQEINILKKYMAI